MRGNIVTREDILKLADKLQERAEEYRKPFDQHDELTDFYSSGSAPTYTALLDVARLIRETVGNSQETVIPTPRDDDDEIIDNLEDEYKWDDCAVEFHQDMEKDGYNVSVMDNDGLIVKTWVHLHEWGGCVTPLINDKNVSGLIKYLKGLNATTEGPRDGTEIRG